MAGNWSRREVLGMVAAGGVGALALKATPGSSTDSRSTDGKEPSMNPAGPILPALFVSHGSPMAALDSDDYTGALEGFGGALPDLEAIVVVSAHWEADLPVRVTTSARPRTIHDFGGFPDALYRMQYPAPGHPKLAEEIVALLRAGGFEARGDADRGLDHGVWCPLVHLRKAADVPVVAVSLPRRMSPPELVRLGQALAPLRRRQVLLLGSGGVVHNLRILDFARPLAPVAEWAGAFDAWVSERLAALDVEALSSYEERAPHARLAVPTTEHFDPLFVVLGARDPGDRLETVYEGFRHATLSLRSFALRSA